MRITKLTLATVCGVFLTGCYAGVVPAPHTGLATPRIHARIVDATTKQPISGVIVRVPERPQICATSSVTGCVTLKPTRNFYWLYLWAEGDKWSEPIGFRWSRELEFIHPDYGRKVITLSLPYYPSDWHSTNLGDIMLKERPK